jgi:hypothetical protein
LKALRTIIALLQHTLYVAKTLWKLSNFLADNVVLILGRIPRLFRTPLVAFDTSITVAYDLKVNTL